MVEAVAFWYNVPRQTVAKQLREPRGKALAQVSKRSFRPVEAGRKIIYDDQQTGARARKARLSAGLTQGKIARRMKISVGYVSDLELGQNRWTEELVSRYIRALK
jgi:predicted transcriptional regulator